MKRLSVLILVMVVLMICAAVFNASASVITWSLPTTYSDNTSIPVSDQGRIVVKLFNGATSAACVSAASAFATSTAGATQWVGTLPVTTKGSTTYYCGTATLDGMESAKSPTVSHTIPFVSPSVPSLINITN